MKFIFHRNHNFVLSPELNVTTRCDEIEIDCQELDMEDFRSNAYYLLRNRNLPKTRLRLDSICIMLYIMNNFSLFESVHTKIGLQTMKKLTKSEKKINLELIFLEKGFET